MKKILLMIILIYSYLVHAELPSDKCKNNFSKSPSSSEMSNTVYLYQQGKIYTIYDLSNSLTKDGIPNKIIDVEFDGKIDSAIEIEPGEDSSLQKLSLKISQTGNGKGRLKIIGDHYSFFGMVIPSGVLISIESLKNLINFIEKNPNASSSETYKVLQRSYIVAHEFSHWKTNSTPVHSNGDQNARTIFFIGPNGSISERVGKTYKYGELSYLGKGRADEVLSIIKDIKAFLNEIYQNNYNVSYEQLRLLRMWSERLQSISDAYIDGFKRMEELARKKHPFQITQISLQESNFSIKLEHQKNMMMGLWKKGEGDYFFLMLPLELPITANETAAHSLVKRIRDYAGEENITQGKWHGFLIPKDLIKAMDSYIPTLLNTAIDGQEMMKKSLSASKDIKMKIDLFEHSYQEGPDSVRQAFKNLNDAVLIYDIEFIQRFRSR